MNFYTSVSWLGRTYLIQLCADIRWSLKELPCMLYDNGGARGEMVIVVGNGHGDTSSNLRQDWLHFT